VVLVFNFLFSEAVSETPRVPVTGKSPFQPKVRFKKTEIFSSHHLISLSIRHHLKDFKG
jgi:hypothetical protein